MTPRTPCIASIFLSVRWHSLEVVWWRPREGMVLGDFRLEDGVMIGNGVWGDVEPAAFFDAFLVVGRSEDVDELCGFEGFEGVDVVGFCGEGGDVVFFEDGGCGVFEELVAFGGVVVWQVGGVVVGCFDFAGAAEDHSGHFGVVVGADEFVLIELEEAE